MAKAWKVKATIPENLLLDLRDYHPLIARILFGRGIKDKVAAEEFLNPQYERLHSPFLFKDMEKAVRRVWEAVEKNEKIVIYGDYDADAVTANAVLRQTFKYLGAAAESYIPDRFSEGYGVNLEALSKIKDEGARIIITVDCGTNSMEAAEFCRANGIDLIITDHHEIIGRVPDAFALINPKNPDDAYPYADITGVGVAFKLACGILASEKCKVKSAKYVPGWEKWLLDLVAIGTVADCHSLLGENRILVKYGLKVLAKTRWPGLRALIASAGLNFKEKPPDTFVLGFILAPRLNAAGRLQHANIALNLLLEEDLRAARQQAAALEQINRKRQDLTLRVLSEAREKAVTAGDRKILVLWNEDWHQGIVGLVAGKLAEEFNKPAIVLEKGLEESLGSARTAGEFDIIASLKYAASHLVRFGGHKQAAGLTLRNENFEDFCQKILEFAEDRLPTENLEMILQADAELEATDLRLEILDLLSALEPFGVDNPKPRFLVSNLQVKSFRPVGSGSKHLQLQLMLGNQTVGAIWFNGNDFAKNLKLDDTVGVIAELFLDNWNGNSNIRLKIVDLRVV
jgi:single-stranded-DNA-specific exonuclease